MGDLMLQVVKSLVQAISLRIFCSHFGLKLSCFGFAVLLKLLFVLLELYELIVEHFDLRLLRREHIFMVPLKPVVVYLRVALVAHAVKRGIVLR